MKRKNLVNGMILAFSVVLVRFVDVRIYDMNLIVTLLLTAALIFGLMKVADRFPALEAPVTKRTANITSVIVIAAIFAAFFAFGL